MLVANTSLYFYLGPRVVHVCNVFFYKCPLVSLLYSCAMCALYMQECLEISVRNKTVGLVRVSVSSWIDPPVP